MTIKKNYNVGDDVWVYGITPANKITKGTVVASIDLSAEGFGETPHYVIGIPTHIETLLEIRTWHTMSQDAQGPIGSLREIGKSLFVDNKKMRQIGYEYCGSEPENTEDGEEPSQEQILAALEKSTDGLTHKPLNIKESKPKRRYYPKRKKL